MSMTIYAIIIANNGNQYTLFASYIMCVVCVYSVAISILHVISWPPFACVQDLVDVTANDIHVHNISLTHEALFAANSVSSDSALNSLYCE